MSISIYYNVMIVQCTAVSPTWMQGKVVQLQRQQQQQQKQQHPFN